MREPKQQKLKANSAFEAMASWVSAWLQGRPDGEGEEEESKSEGYSMTDGSAAPPPSADELRRRRLERLQQLEDERRAAEAEAKAQAQSGDQDEPMAPVKPTPPPPTPVPVAPVEKPKPRMPTPPKKPISSRAYVNDMLQRVLRVTLSPSSDSSLVFLADLASEDNAELSAANVSEALYSRIVMDPAELVGGMVQPLAAVAYLEQSYYRSRDEAQKLQSSFVRLTPEDKRDAEQCLSSVRDMCVNYSATALTEPDMFPFETGTINQEALEKLVRAQANPLTPEFVDAVAAELEQSGATSAVFAPIFQKLLSELFLLSPPSVLSSFFDNMFLLSTLCRNKALATAFTSIPGFLLPPGGPLSGRRLQDATALGILLRFQCGQDPAVQQLFTNLSKRTKNDVDSSILSLRNKLTTLQATCADIVTLILKAGGVARERVLAWLEQAVQVNAERAKENPDANVASSNGMILNLTMVLLRLCGPFLAPDSTKHRLIDVGYLATQNAVFPADVTRLLAQAEGVDHQQQQDDRRPASASSFNFITRCYFLTARAVHLGPVGIMGQYMRLLRQLSYFQSRMNAPNADPRLRPHFDQLATSKMIMDAELLHPELLNELLRFVLLSCKVVNRLCVGDTSDVAAVELPLAAPSSHANSALPFLPEDVVDDICSALIFVARLEPKALNGLAFDELLMMILVFLSSPAYVRSPHLRAKMSEVLFFLFLPNEEVDDRQTAGAPLAVELLVTHPLAQRHLAPCLLELYGDVEQTGFYEKLEHRYNIACLLKYLWRLGGHKAAFLRIAEARDAFVKFSHGLMNHINSLVTDALSSLPEIKLLQEEMADVPRWMALDDAAREQKQSLLADKERTVTSSLQLANETIHMMSYLTSEIQAPFVAMPDMRERLVSMLSSVLVKLAGPRGVELKVNNPEQYKFRPKEMLKEIVETMLHFAGYPEFVDAVAANGYYDGQVFAKAAHIAGRTQLLPPGEVEAFEAFVADVARAAQSVADLEASLGEIPDEFLDPLVFTLMKDPVELPSGYSMDRACITQHLLNDQSDPFTRAPLTTEQLRPNTELKARIEQWIREKQQEQQQQ